MKIFSLASMVVMILTSITYAIAEPLSTGKARDIAHADSGRIFGEQRENTYKNNALLRDAFGESMGIPNETISSQGYTFVDGCRVHSCIEKAVVTVNETTLRLAAGALLHFNCALIVAEPNLSYSRRYEPGPDGRVHGQHQCDAEPVLEIFIFRREHSDVARHEEVKLRDELRKWGKQFGYAREVVRVWETD